MMFQYNSDQKDLLSWYRHNFQTSDFSCRNRNRYVAKWAGLYFGTAVIVACYFQNWASLAIGLVCAAALSLTTRPLYNRQMIRQLEQFAAQPKLKAILGQQQLMLSDEELQQISPVAKTHVSWDKVYNLVADEKHIFIELISGQAILVSNKSFSGPCSFEELPNVLAQFKQRHVTA